MIINIILIINTVIYGLLAFRVYRDVQDIRISQKITEQRNKTMYLQHLLWLKCLFEQREEYENASRVSRIIKDLEEE